MGLDQIQSRSYVLVEVDLHHLESGLGNRAIPQHLLFEHLKYRGPFILQVCVRVLSIYVEDDLPHCILRKPTSVERNAVVRSALPLAKSARGLHAHSDSCLDYLLNCVRLARTGHSEQSRALPEEVL